MFGTGGSLVYEAQHINADIPQFALSIKIDHNTIINLHNYTTYNYSRIPHYTNFLWGESIHCQNKLLGPQSKIVFRHVPSPQDDDVV